MHPVTGLPPAAAQIVVAQQSLDADVLAPVLGQLFNASRRSGASTPRSRWRSFTSLGRSQRALTEAQLSVHETLAPSPEFRDRRSLARCAPA